MSARGSSKASKNGNKLAELVRAEEARSTPTAVVIDPSLPEHEQIRAAIIAAREVWSVDSIELAYQMARGHVAGIWSKFKTPKYEREDDFWVDLLGIAPRTIDRMIGVGLLIDKLPEPDRPHIKAALAQIGFHKADIIRPMLIAKIEEATKTEAPAVVHWREWTDKAAATPEPKLQEIVGQARGIRRVGSGTTAGPTGGRGGRAQGRQAEDPLLTYIANKMPTQELKDQTLEVFAFGYEITGSDQAVAVLIALVQEAYTPWKHEVDNMRAQAAQAQAPPPIIDLDTDVEVVEVVDSATADTPPPIGDPTEGDPDADAELTLEDEVDADAEHRG